MSEEGYSRGELRLDEVKGLVNARIQRAVDEAMARPAPEIFEPEGWGNIWALGPIQPIGPGGPLRPHQVVKVGEPFYVATFMWLSPFLVLPNGPTVCDLVTNLGCEFEVKYCTGDLCSWTPGPSPMNLKSSVPLVPDQCFYLDIQGWVAQEGWEGCYEMNICARVTGCAPGAAPSLAGFVTRVQDIDADMFYPIGPGVQPRYQFDIPIRFMIYP